MPDRDQWGPWIQCTVDNPMPAKVGEYVRVHAYLNRAFYKRAEGFVQSHDLAFYRCCVSLLRPGLDSIYVRIRRPRGMRHIDKAMQNLPIRVLTE